MCDYLPRDLHGAGVARNFHLLFYCLFHGSQHHRHNNRKLFFRFVGSIIGRMILGIGCLVFFFPNLEGVQGFLLVIAGVSFLGAWIAATPYFGYIGMQIVISFNFIAFERLRDAGQMTPARDRLLGITLGFLVMFFIFHQVRPERAVDTMRRLLARVLRAQAGIIRTFAVVPESERDAKIAGMRKQIATAVAICRISRMP